MAVTWDQAPRLATPVEQAGRFGLGYYLSVQPLVSSSWGLDGESFQLEWFRLQKLVWPAS